MRKNRMKKLAGMLLAACFAVGLLPAGALAADPYNLWVGGVEVTANGQEITSANNAGITSGKATFSVDASGDYTLTLDGFTYEGSGYRTEVGGDTCSAAIYYGGSKPLTIVAKGENTVTCTSTSRRSCGICINTAQPLTFTGGALEAIAIGDGSQDIFGISGNGGASITIENGILSGASGADSGQTPVNRYGVVFSGSSTITVNGGELIGTAAGTEAEDASGGVRVRNITINGGKLTGTAGTAYDIWSAGVSTHSGDGITVNGGELVGIGGEMTVSGYSAGISPVGGFTIKGGKVTGKGGTSASDTSYGVRAYNNDTVYDVKVSGGEVIAEGSNAAFSNAPTIDAAFNGGVWYGADESAANANGERPTSELAANHSQKYVRIAQAAASLTITITTQPRDANVTEGSISGSLTVAASVSPSGTPTYQWYSCTSDDKSGAQAISGATGASFSIPTDLTEGTYYYFCRVSATGATDADSNAAKVTVTAGGGTPPPTPTPVPTPTPSTGGGGGGTDDPPIITSPIKDQSVTAYAGESATLSITATGATSYQWYIDRGDGRGFVPIPGAAGPTYITSAVAPENDGYRYRCVASNADGSDTSPVFTLNVLGAAPPQTGDNSRLGLWIALAMFGLAGITAAGIGRLRRQRES